MNYECYLQMIQDTAQLSTNTTILNIKMIKIEMYDTNEYIK